MNRLRSQMNAYLAILGCHVQKRSFAITTCQLVTEIRMSDQPLNTFKSTQLKINILFFSLNFKQVYGQRRRLRPLFKRHQRNFVGDRLQTCTSEDKKRAVSVVANAADRGVLLKLFKKSERSLIPQDNLQKDLDLFMCDGIKRDMKEKKGDCLELYVVYTHITFPLISTKLKC